MIINLLNPVISGAASKSISDEEAIEAYLETQNTNYFNILYDRYSRKVFGKCYSLLKSEARAEDAAQEIFVKVLLNLSKFSGKSKFSTWLYSITYNFCIDTIRKSKKNIGVLVDDIGRYGDVVEDEIEDSEIIETNVYRLKEVLNILPSGDKAILLMKYQDEFSIKEICKIIDKSESAVKMKIKRAKEKFLRKYKELYTS
ncbi:MAG: RNA polymerase sigma factor [Saprospiraceae bacterium]|nr:RNA polymerase sigma factor [Saprospiraceae bacterium]